VNIPVNTRECYRFTDFWATLYVAFRGEVVSLMPNPHLEDCGLPFIWTLPLDHSGVGDPPSTLRPRYYSFSDQRKRSSPTRYDNNPEEVSQNLTLSPIVSVVRILLRVHSRAEIVKFASTFCISLLIAEHKPW
jgi:hypothetical protein